MAAHHSLATCFTSLLCFLSVSWIQVAQAQENNTAAPNSMLEQLKIDPALQGNAKVEKAAAHVVEDVFPIMRKINKDRLDHPHLNQFDVGPPSTGPTKRAESPQEVAPNDNAVLRGSETQEAAKILAEAASLSGTASRKRRDVEAASLKAQYWNDVVGDDSAQAYTDEKLDKRSPDTYWMESMVMNGKAPHAEDGYKIFRNVRDYGAKGDGKTDDTEAINRAVSDGARCGQECGSSMDKPAVIYFPSGTYLVSRSIIQYYNTQFIGNPIERPTILAAPSFVGLGVLTSNKYIDGGNGAEWYIPQSNFHRSIRNFIIDITNTDPQAYVCGIHWQVAQATDLTRIDFYMKPGTTQQGIYMENGSGGFMSELYFRGGNFGAYLGNQQFTTRNLIFHDCKNALQIHWNWAWSMHSIYVIGSPGQTQTGIVIEGGAGGPEGAGVGSFVLFDSFFSNLDVGISTSLLDETSTSLLLENCNFNGTKSIVKDKSRNEEMLPGAKTVKKVEAWGFGKMVLNGPGASKFERGNLASTVRPSGLTVRTKSSSQPRLVPDGKMFGKSSPTYQKLQASEFVNVKSSGAQGDGKTDDTCSINQALAKAAKSKTVVFFPYGTYLVSDTIRIPAGSRIVGQAWPQIVGSGRNFQDAKRPRPVVSVGQPGDSGIIEISDMLFTTRAGSAGAVVVEWNIQETEQGSAAMWNSPIRVGGTTQSGLQAKECPKKTGKVNKDCIAAAMLLHLTPSSSAYLENIWAWTADHDLEGKDQTQIDIYVARGILVESKKPTWLWGTASEHNVLYQYQLSGAKEVFLSMLQTESPYFQPSPRAPAPFDNDKWPGDPSFEHCSTSTTCAMAWALRIMNSTDILVYSAGLYSFFSDYSSECLKTASCQDASVHIQDSSNVSMHALQTRAIMQMVSPAKGTATLAANNRNGVLSSLLTYRLSRS